MRAQVQGKNRERVAETARKLGLDGTYIPRSYIEQVSSTPWPHANLADMAFAGHGNLV